MLKALELKIPPPAVGALTAAAMWAFARPGGDTATLSGAHWLIVAVLAGIGALFDFSALFAFRRAKTTVNPMKPGATTAIVHSGVYRITRNPMYVGLVFFLCAWAVYLGSPLALLGPIAFVAYITRFQIIPEERVLIRMFGVDYEAYKTRVRRWL